MDVSYKITELCFDLDFNTIIIYIKIIKMLIIDFRMVYNIFKYEKTLLNLKNYFLYRVYKNNLKVIPIVSYF